MAEYIFDEFGAFPKYEEDKDKYVVFACAKNESEYIREWADHYFKLGFDKIFIADNNDNGDDSLYEALGDYIDEGKVQVFDCRGHESVQVLVYSRFCEAGNYKWCGYFDCDEFFEMSVYTDIKEFLAQMEEYDCISFNWLTFGPNGQFFKKEGKVQDRFPLPISPVLYFKENVFIKSIVKGGERRFSNCWFNGSHVPQTDNPDIKYSIGGYNEPYESKTIHAHYPPSYKFGYIKHYYTKSYQEWREKASRGWPDGTKSLDLSRFYLFNESYTVPPENFLNGLFNNSYNDGNTWSEVLDNYSVIELRNDGCFIYPFIMNTISLMLYGKGHTFVITGDHIDDTLYAILLEYAYVTGNRLFFARNTDEVVKVYQAFHGENEITYYIITIS